MAITNCTSLIWYNTVFYKYSYLNSTINKVLKLMYIYTVYGDLKETTKLINCSKGYSIKTYHPGGDPTLKLAKPPLEVQLSVYRPTLEPCSFNTYPPLEEIFISFRMVLVVCIMYVCMYVCMYTPV